MKYTFTNEKNTFRATVENVSKSACFTEFAKEHNGGTFSEIMMIKKEDGAFAVYVIAARKGELVLNEKMSPTKKRTIVNVSQINITPKAADYEWQLNDTFLQVLYENSSHVKFIFPGCPYLFLEVPTDIILMKIKDENFILDYGYTVEDK